MDNIIESSNFWWTLVAGFSFFCYIRLIRRSDISEYNREIICAWAWVVAASGVNHGWFALSRHLSDDHNRWNNTMFEWRWLVVLLSAGAFCWGTLRFIRLIDDRSFRWQIMVFIGLFAVTFTAGFY